MVDKLNEYPEWKINLELEPETWDTVQIKDAEAYRNFKNIVYSPRIEFTNPAYAQSYFFNTSGESIIRQFELGIKKLRFHFPGLSFYTYATEEPCFTSALPQILKSFGFRHAVLKNPDTCWGGYVRGYGKDAVNWIGPDGTSLLTVPRYECEAFEDNSTWQTTAWDNSDKYLQACREAGIQNPVGMCYQDAGWENGPWIGHGENIRNASRYITWKEYFSTVLSCETAVDWKLSQEDIRVSLMWGSQALQQIARQVRHSENTLVKAEKMLALAHIENGFVSACSSLENAWRSLLLAQHHDAWIVPYNRLDKNKTWADQVSLWTGNTNKISSDIIQLADSLLSKKNRSSSALGYLKVYNTLPEKRTEVIAVKLPEEWKSKEIAVYNIGNELVESVTQLKEGEAHLICNATVPALGYTTFRLEETRTKPRAANPGISFPTSNECVMENDRYKIVFDLSHGGKIKSLVAKSLENKDFVDSDNDWGFNEINGYFYREQRFISNSETPAQITVLEDNAFRKQVKIESQIAGHPCYQVITLNQSQQRIDFSLRVDWKENTGIGEFEQGKNWRANRRAFYDSRYKLKVLFPSSIKEQKIYKNAPFDVCRSNLTNTFFNTWDSIKNDVILNWVDMVQEDGSYGLALLTDHTTSYLHGNDFPLGLTLQYSGKGLWGVDYTITHPLDVKYALIPHKGTWEEALIPAQSNLWNETCIVSLHKNTEMSEKSFLQFDKKGYELTSMQPEGATALVVRIFNWESDAGALTVKCGFPVSACEEIELNGQLKETHSVGNDNRITIAIPRFGFTTLRIQKQVN
ncbi:MAG: alpha-mannosidase, partial [Tannerella sp.]|jgi:alpha-mannosidase|nr:alpha-mannosidase [Tannerella sp.]